MRFQELGTFDVAHRQLAWPWIAIDVSRTRFAFASADDRIDTRQFSEGALTDGPSFALPSGLGLPTAPAAPTGHRGTESGAHGFSLSPDATLLAVTGIVDGASVVVTLDATGERRRSRLDALSGGDFVGHAVAFDRSGARLWISAESGTETALVLIDARSHAVLGVVRSPPFPPPASHELHVHPQDDAVLLLAACGQDGTFARVAGWSDGPPAAVPTALDGGSLSAGFVGFSADAARVHLVEADELRTHSWPGLELLSSVDLDDEFISSYAGVVLGDRILIDGENRDAQEDDAVMTFDRSALRGALQHAPVPTGMWVGRLGSDALVTVESKGDPGVGRVIRLPAPQS